MHTKRECGILSEDLNPLHLVSNTYLENPSAFVYSKNNTWSLFAACSEPDMSNWATLQLFPLLKTFGQRLVHVLYVKLHNGIGIEINRRLHVETNVICLAPRMSCFGVI